MTRVVSLALAFIVGGCAHVGVQFIDCDYDPALAASIVDASVQTWPESAERVDRLDVVCVESIPPPSPEYRASAGQTIRGGSSFVRAKILLSRSYDHGDVCKSALAHELQHLRLWPRPTWGCPNHAKACGWDETATQAIEEMADCP